MSPDGIIDKESIVSLIGKLWGNFATGRVGRVSLDCVDYLNCQTIVGVLEGREGGKEGRREGEKRGGRFLSGGESDFSRFGEHRSGSS